jgi:hypothetical protein
MGLKLTPVQPQLRFVSDAFYCLKDFFNAEDEGVPMAELMSSDPTGDVYALLALFQESTTDVLHYFFAQAAVQHVVGWLLLLYLTVKDDLLPPFSLSIFYFI